MLELKANEYSVSLEVKGSKQEIYGELAVALTAFGRHFNQNADDETVSNFLFQYALVFALKQVFPEMNNIGFLHLLESYDKGELGDLLSINLENEE